MRNRWIAIVLLFAIWATASAAQEKPPAQPAEKAAEPAAASSRQAEPGVPLKISLVISRHRGEKRISSLPYLLGVVANGARTTLRMGSDVPIPSVIPGKDALIPQQPYSYRSVGTNIDCQAFTERGGQFRLLVTVQDSSVHVDPGDKSLVPARLPDVPTFRTFNSSFTILLRDGQSTEYTSATDPVTGEVMKIDVALNVLK